MEFKISKMCTLVVLVDLQQNLPQGPTTGSNGHLKFLPTKVLASNLNSQNLEPTYGPQFPPIVKYLPFISRTVIPDNRTDSYLRINHSKIKTRGPK